MTNSSSNSAPQRSAAAVSLRKTNKPLMEKKRRARINNSLTQLKSLVIQSSKKDSSQFNKLEKADILELTVKHLRNLQGRELQQTQAITADSTGKYCAGFMECANEVLRFLKQSQGFNEDTKSRVMGHLASCLQLQFNTQPYLKSQQPQQISSSATTNSPVLANGAVLSANAQQQPNLPVTVPTPQAAQLSNGQIIHIVNAAPYQSIQQANKPVVGQFAPSVQVPTSAPAMDQSTPQYPPHPHSHPNHHQSPLKLSVVSPNVPQPTPTTAPAPSQTLFQDKSYTRFSQPLHIQIPTSNVSPSSFVLKPDTSRPQPEEPRHLHHPITTTNTLPGSKPQPPATTAPILSPADTVRSSLSSSSPSPLPSDLQPLNPSKPKHVHFHPADHLTTDYLPPRHRTYSTASSSSSSSESEMSPLNLSQSPTSSSTSSTASFSHSHRHESIRTDYLPMKFKLDKVSPTAFNQLFNSRELKENVDHNTNFTSVIVNARRPLDAHKYLDMEDDRLCPRPHGTPSPASSMGEERLWRPW